MQSHWNLRARSDQWPNKSDIFSVWQKEVWKMMGGCGSFQGIHGSIEVRRNVRSKGLQMKPTGMCCIGDVKLICIYIIEFQYVSLFSSIVLTDALLICHVFRERERDRQLDIQHRCHIEKDSPNITHVRQHIPVTIGCGACGGAWDCW